MEVTFELRSGETWRDPFAMYAGLRDHDPVHHVPESRPGAGDDHFVLSRFDDVFRAARDTATFSSAQGLTPTYDDMALAGLDAVAPMVMLDPPRHTDLRRLVARGFTPRRVREIEDEVRALVVERVERVRAVGAADVATELFDPIPSYVVGLYLGVPAEDRARFDRWTAAIVAASAGGDVLAAPDAVGELFGYFTTLAERRRRDPGPDAFSALAEAGVDTGPMLGFAFTMVTGGNDTSSGLLGVAAELLTAHLDQRAELIADPSLLADAVEELLRLASPVQGLARTATADVRVHDTTIPAGRKVLLLYGSANRDPREYGPDSEQLDVRRAPARILSFGSGAHHCLGAAAARLIGRVTLEELLARCPDFTVDAAAGTFAPGSFVRRYDSLPFDATGAAS